METALRYEIQKAIPALKDRIYPTNAPENAKNPYLVYMRTRTNFIKTLNGYTGHQAFSYMFSVMAPKYADMVALRKQIMDLLLTFPGRFIGENNDFYVEDIEINNVVEQYEHELKINRGIIDFTIFKEAD